MLGCILSQIHHCLSNPLPIDDDVSCAFGIQTPISIGQRPGFGKQFFSEHCQIYHL
jgi:hypothetical protein